MSQPTTSPFTVSLWLVPPPLERERLYEKIVYLSRKNEYGGENSEVVFQPHITVLGGIECQSMDHAREILQNKLAPSLKSFGSVNCELTGTAFMVRENDDGAKTPVWSQAAVLVMQEMQATERFRQLGITAHHLLGLDHSGEKWTLAPPLSTPHLSLYYGTSNVRTAADVEELVPTCFVAKELQLWKTHPNGVEGVKEWELIGIIPLCCEETEDADGV